MGNTLSDEQGLEQLGQSNVQLLVVALVGLNGASGVEMRMTFTVSCKAFFAKTWPQGRNTNSACPFASVPDKPQANALRRVLARKEATSAPAPSAAAVDEEAAARCLGFHLSLSVVTSCTRGSRFITKLRQQDRAQTFFKLEMCAS